MPRSALVDSAIQMEGKINQANDNRKRRMMHQNGPNNAQKHRPSPSGGYAPRPTKPPVPTSRPNNPNHYGGHPKPGGNHNNNNHGNNNNNNFNNNAPRTGSNAVPTAPRNKSTVTCYECGIVGHYSYECPQKLMKAANNAAPKPNEPAQQQRRVAAGRKSGPSNPNNRHGRFNSIRATEALEALTTALSMFPVNHYRLKHARIILIFRFNHPS